jgi:hypothetical protein
MYSGSTCREALRMSDNPLRWYNKTRRAIARLRDQLRRPKGDGRGVRDDVTTVVKAAEHALELAPFAGHQPSCDRMTRKPTGRGCTCGFEAVQEHRRTI